METTFEVEQSVLIEESQTEIKDSESTTSQDDGETPEGPIFTTEYEDTSCNSSADEVAPDFPSNLPHSHLSNSEGMFHRPVLR